jgi:hypothetical protein
MKHYVCWEEVVNAQSRACTCDELDPLTIEQRYGEDGCPACVMCSLLQAQRLEHVPAVAGGTITRSRKPLRYGYEYCNNCDGTGTWVHRDMFDVCDEDGCEDGQVPVGSQE